MTDFAFLLDLSQCIGCNACTVACKTGNELSSDEQFIHLIEQTRGEFPNLSGGFQNHRCYHCLDAACVSVCPTGSLFKEDGLTRLNRDDCSGCGYCVDACPYDVPVMVDGRSSKCDGCADVVKAGGKPWCVRTCPSNALVYAERDALMAEADRRVAAIAPRYPKAQVYGKTQAGGLGVIMVLPDDPEVLDLPPDPQVPLIATAWQKVVQPATITLTAGMAAVAGVVAIIGRRNHMAELGELERAEAVAASTSSSSSSESESDTDLENGGPK